MPTCYNTLQISIPNSWEPRLIERHALQPEVINDNMRKLVFLQLILINMTFLVVDSGKCTKKILSQFIPIVSFKVSPCYLVIFIHSIWLVGFSPHRQLHDWGKAVSNHVLPRLQLQRRMWHQLDHYGELGRFFSNILVLKKGDGTYHHSKRGKQNFWMLFGPTKKTPSYFSRTTIFNFNM